MTTATVSSKFQISIPKEVREAMHIEPGQQYEFIPMGRSFNSPPRLPSKICVALLLEPIRRNIVIARIAPDVFGGYLRLD